MTNADQPEVVPHWCECNPGWKGRNCDSIILIFKFSDSKVANILIFF